MRKLQAAQHEKESKALRHRQQESLDAKTAEQLRKDVQQMRDQIAGLADTNSKLESTNVIAINALQQEKTQLYNKSEELRLALEKAKEEARTAVQTLEKERQQLKVEKLEMDADYKVQLDALRERIVDLEKDNRVMQ